MTVQPTFSFKPDGTWTFTVAQKPTHFDVKTHTETLPDGRKQLYERVWDPDHGRFVNKYAIGMPTVPEKLEAYSLLVSQAWGIPASNPLHGRLLGTLTVIEHFIPKEKQEFAIQKLAAEVQAMAGRPGGATALVTPGTNIMGPTAGAAPTGGGVSSTADLIGGARSAAEAAALVQKGRETTQAETIKRAEAPLGQTEQARMDFYRLTRQQLDVVKQTYNPDFVGKGWEPFIKGAESEFQKHLTLANKGQYAPGAWAGAVRTLLGTASVEETQFRRAVLDVSDAILRARSGAQINEQEAKRLQGLLFQVTDSPKIFEAALKRFEASINENMKFILEGKTISPAEQLKTERARTAPLGIPPPKGASRKPVMRVTPDGRWIGVP
jgi:hypothetical protein